MEEKTIICTVCPQGCHITVRAKNGAISSVEGFRCRRGEQYAKSEFTNPVRILTSTALVSGSDAPLVALRSNKPIPKELLMPCMKEIRALRLMAPIHSYDVLIPNILNTGADIVATGETFQLAENRGKCD